MIEKRRKKYFIINRKVQMNSYYLLFIFLIPIVALYFYLNDRQEIIDSFNKNKKLTCNVSHLTISVKKDDNWKLDGFNFVKDETKIVVSKCEVKE